VFLHFVKGTVLEGKGDNCTAVRNLLCGSFRTSTTVKKKDFEGQSRAKKEQTEYLKHHSSHGNWWADELPGESSFLIRGGEAKIYLGPDRKSVIKINDTVFFTVSE
jgi:Serine/Threonine/Tyrosine Kinase found in polyvalent proteins